MLRKNFQKISYSENQSLNRLFLKYFLKNSAGTFWLIDSYRKCFFVQRVAGCLNFSTTTLTVCHDRHYRESRCQHQRSCLEGRSQNLIRFSKSQNNLYFCFHTKLKIYVISIWSYFWSVLPGFSTMNNYDWKYFYSKYF